MANDLTLTSPSYTTVTGFGQSLSGGTGVVANPFPTSGTWTLECRLKATNAGGLKVAAGANTTCWFGMDSSGNLEVRYGGSSEVALATGAAIGNNAWHHVRLVMSASGAKVFLDGALVGSNTTTFSAAGGGTANPFGARYFPVAPGTFDWPGEVDEIALWSIATNTTTFTPPTTPYTGAEVGLVSLWHLDGNGLDSAVVVTNNALTSGTANVLFSPGNWNIGTSTAKTINAGAYFRTIFTGATCSLTFDLTNVLTPLPQISYQLDGLGAWTTVSLTATVAITVPTSTSDYAAKGGHLLEFIVKSMTETQSRWLPQATAVHLTGVMLDTSATLTKPAELPLSGLVDGDSITECVRTVNGTAANDTDRNDARQGWAYNAAKILGAEVGIIGFGATGFTTSGSGGVPALTTSYNLIYSGVSRTFASTLRFIVLMMGTNDSGDVTTAATTVLNGYIAATPATTKIIVFRPFNGTAHASQLQAAIAACSLPARCTYVDTAGWFNTANSYDALHPYGNENMYHIAPLAAAAIRQILNDPRPATSKTVTLTLKDRTGALRASVTGLRWHWSDTFGTAIDSGTGATTDASGVFSVSVRTTLATAGIGYLHVTNDTGAISTSTIAFSGPVAVA